MRVVFDDTVVDDGGLFRACAGERLMSSLFRALPTAYERWQMKVAVVFQQVPFADLQCARRVFHTRVFHFAKPATPEES